MCGLSGMLTNGKLSEFELRQAERLFINQYDRGTHSTGFIAGNGRTAPLFYKTTGHPFSLVSKNVYWRGAKTGFLKDSSFVAFHNRHATKGEVKVENAHPFVDETDKVIGMHNGTLTGVWKGHNKYETDSEAIINLLGENESTPEGITNALKDLTGAYALCWYDTRDGVLRFVRNNERPLHFLKSFVNLFWSSEEMPLRFFRTKYVKDDELFQLDAHTLLQVDPSIGVRSMELIPLKGLEAPKVNHYRQNFFQGSEGVSRAYGHERDWSDEIPFFGCNLPTNHQQQQRERSANTDAGKKGKNNSLQRLDSAFQKQTEGVDKAGSKGSTLNKPRANILYTYGSFKDYSEPQRMNNTTGGLEICLEVPKEAGSPEYEDMWITEDEYIENVVNRDCTNCGSLPYNPKMERLYISRDGRWTCMGNSNDSLDGKDHCGDAWSAHLKDEKTVTIQ